MIGATELQTLTGAKGDGIKIGIVDDGVDSTNPFLNPAGYSYPAGFPKGGRKWTTPKVIVARAFPGPNSGRAGRLPIDREASFHATHVAGIAAGDSGTCSPGGRDHPPTCGLTGVAPRAWIGNYRVFNVPTPIGHVANTPEIAAAFEFAVRDGMDVINFSGGGAETEPANDAMIDVIRNVTAAGVVPVISAGNDRDQFGMGSVGSPGSAPEAITVAAVSNTHVFAPVLSVRSAGAPADLKSIAIAGAGGTRFPSAYAFGSHRLVDVGALSGTNGTPVDRRLCGPDDDTNNPAKSSLRTGLAERGHRAPVPRTLHVPLEGDASRSRRRDRARGRRQPLRRAGCDSDRAAAAGRNDLRPRRRQAPRVSRHDGRRRRRDDRQRNPASRDRPQRRHHELLVRRTDRVRAPAQTGRVRPWRPDPLVHSSGVQRRLAVRSLRRHEHGRPTRLGRSGAAPPAPPRHGRRSRSSPRSCRRPAPPGQTPRVRRKLP